MSRPVTARDILQGIPQDKLDSPVSDVHIAELANEIKSWEDYVPYIGLTEPEEVEIRMNFLGRYGLQKREALRKWKQKLGSGATYRQLIIVLCCSQHTELAEKVKKLLLPKPSKGCPCTPNILQTFRDYLVDCYTETTPPSRLQWPFSSMSSYIDLTLTEVPLSPEVPSQADKAEEGDSPQPQPLQRVPLGEVFRVGSRRKAKRNVVVLEGPAGCGKTTLTWHACREWAAGRLFQQFSLLVHISLESPDSTLLSAKSLADIIPHPSAEIREAVARAISEQHGKGVCFLFDALDEASPALLQRSSFLYKFIAGMSGKMLPRCSIAITSRPVAVGMIYPLLTGRIVIEGFSAGKMEEFIDARLGHDSAAKKELFKAFKLNRQLIGLCSLPLNAAIFVHLYHSFGQKLPSTRTELFDSLVRNLLLRHMQLRTSHELHKIENYESLPSDIFQKFSSICSLAFHGLMESRGVFGIQDLKHEGLASPHNTLSLMQAHQQLTGFGFCQQYTFVHYAVQEFLAAYHISRQNAVEQTEILRKILHHTPLSSVLPFYAGLTKLSNESVRELLLEVAKYPLDCESIFADLAKSPSTVSSDRRRLLLALLNCIYESQKKSICKEVNPPSSSESMVQFLPEKHYIVSFAFLGLDPLDCLSIAYVMANKNEMGYIDASNCHISDVGLEVLMMQPPESLECEPCALVFGASPLSEAAMKTISKSLSVVRYLYLTRMWHPLLISTSKALKYLIEGLSRNTSCRLLGISYNHVEHQHIYHLILLITCCKNLQWLALSGSNIGNAMFLFTKALEQNTNLQVLFLDDCNINDTGLHHLGRALQVNKTLEALYIGNNPFSSAAVTSFLGQLDNSTLSYLICRHSLTTEQKQLVELINWKRRFMLVPPLEVVDCSSASKRMEKTAEKIVGFMKSLPPHILSRLIQTTKL